MVASLCTFPLGQETGLKSAVRDIQIQLQHTVFCFILVLVLVKAPRKGFLSILLGSLVIMYDFLQNSRHLL